MPSCCCNPWDSLFNLPITLFIYIHRFLFDASSALLLSISVTCHHHVYVPAAVHCTFSDPGLDIYFPVCPVLFMHTVLYCAYTYREPYCPFKVSRQFAGWFVFCVNVQRVLQYVAMIKCFNFLNISC